MKSGYKSDGKTTKTLLYADVKLFYFFSDFTSSLDDTV